MWACATPAARRTWARASTWRRVRTWSTTPTSQPSWWASTATSRTTRRAPPGPVLCPAPAQGFAQIQYATLCLRENPGCAFIATNCDAVTHLTDAQEWAGNGSMVGALRGSSQREPTVVGKPAAFMLDYIASKFGVRTDQMCMVGDRLDTDILFGQDGGTRTLLVLSGVTTREELLAPGQVCGGASAGAGAQRAALSESRRSYPQLVVPDHYADSLHDVLKLSLANA